MVSLRSQASHSLLPSPSMKATKVNESPGDPVGADSTNTTDHDVESSTLDDRDTNISEPTTSSTITPNPDGKPKRVAALRSVKKSKRDVAKKKTRFCLCKGLDDGTPMILCNECHDWYHFRCINLAERDAEDIRLYICPSCHEKTGLRTVMEWEGEGAIEKRSEEEIEQRLNSEAGEGNALVGQLDGGQSGSSGDEGSGDEYVGEEASRKQAKRRPRQLPESESGSESEGEARQRKRPKAQQRQESASRLHPPANNPSGKRRQSSTEEPTSKRHKSNGSATDDPARRFCLGKLEQTICPIFMEYPHLDGEERFRWESGQNIISLGDEEKGRVETLGKEFVSRLEQCVFETYAELDKTGAPSVGPKYKERFRMLTFNLSKADRVSIRQRIAASQITPGQLSVMSSTDLANEQTKQSIAAAQKEALEHSILREPSGSDAPRAKITHKGFEDIEDANFDASAKREGQPQLEEEEKDRQRKKLGLQATRRASAQNNAVASSKSPVPAHPVTWRGPPPLPAHVLVHGSPGRRLLSRPLFVSTDSDMIPPVEGELNLTDLINIDDETSTETSLVQDPVLTPSAEPPEQDKHTKQKPPSPSVMQGSPVTALSPFAQKPDPQPSFDLSSLWSGPEPEGKDIDQSGALSLRPTQREERKESEPEDEATDGAVPTEDQDFDMFLGNEDEPSATNNVQNGPTLPDLPMTEAEKFATLPIVWMGPLTMPIENTVPLGSPMIARQIGGQDLRHDAPAWKTLFPSESIRIDGRVPVDKAAPYLLQMRMNSTKELVAVALLPKSDLDKSSYQSLVDFLIGKSRYGLIFPWGMKPPDSAPGRELYIVPLLTSQSVPDYMEMLDDFRLPKSREENMLIGVWVLNKGKLPFSPPTASTSTSSPVVSQPPSLPQINPDVLAAEVASLTPEQIQLMLQTLSAVNPLTGAVQSTTPGPTIHPPPGLWPAGAPHPPLAVNYPPPSPQPAPFSNSPHHNNSPPHYQSPPFDGRASPGTYGRDRGDRGGRGRGARGRGRGDSEHTRYPPDRGWGNRGRVGEREDSSHYSSNTAGRW